MSKLSLILIVFLALFPLCASAQNKPIYQSGLITPGHTVRVQANGVVSDAGGSAGSANPQTGYLTEIGITNTGTPFCVNDALTNSPGGYHQFCLGANALGGGLISYNAYGGASPLPLLCNINGVTSSCLNATPAGLTIVTNNVALKATSTVNTPFVVRASYASSGDAPEILYYASGSPCSLNAGAGDDGSQVQSSDSKCWLGIIPPKVADVRIWGANTAASDNTTAFNNAGLWANSVGGADVFIPAGIWIVGCSTAWTAYSYDRFVGVGDSASTVKLCANSTTDAFQTVNVTTMVPTTISNSSVTISNSGTKSFSVGTGLQFTVGQRVQAVVTGTTSYVTGVVSSYSGSTLQFTADRSNGGGSSSTWTITQVGNNISPAVNGSTGPVYVTLKDLQIDGNAPNNTSNPNARCMFTYASALRIDGTVSLYNCQGIGWEMHSTPSEPNFAGENAANEMGRLWVSRANQRATGDIAGGIGGGGMFVNGGTDGRYNDVLVGWSQGGYSLKTGPNGNFRSSGNEYYGGGYPDGTDKFYQPTYGYINECNTGQCFTSSNMFFSNGASSTYILVRTSGFHMTGGGYTYTNAIQASNTTNTIGTGTLTFTTTTTDLGFSAGKNIHIAAASSPTSNYMDGTVTSYNATSGVLVVSISSTAGSGTFASWQVGPAFYQTFIQVGDNANGYTATDIDVDTYVQDAAYNYLVNYDLDGGLNRIRIRGFNNYTNQTSICTNGTQSSTDVVQINLQANQGAGISTPCYVSFTNSFVWTPTLFGSGTAGTPTYGSPRVGSYTIGPEGTVHAWGNLRVTNLGGIAGNVNIGGLPVTSTVTGSDNGLCVINYTEGITTNSSAFTQISALVPPAGTTVQLQQSGPGQMTTTITDANISAPLQADVYCAYHQ